MEARKSQIATTIEQSKRLMEAGLDPESADMCYIEEIITNGIGCISYKHTWSEYPCVDTHEESEGPEPVSLPAWSLSRLWDICNDSGIGPFNFGGDDIESSGLVAKLVDWIILGVHDYEVLDEYLNAETRQELRHADH